MKASSSSASVMRNRAARLQQLADVLAAKDSPAAQNIGLTLQFAATLRLIRAERLDGRAGAGA